MTETPCQLGFPSPLGGLDEDRDEAAGTSRGWRPRLLAGAPSGLKTDTQAASEMW